MYLIFLGAMLTALFGLITEIHFDLFVWTVLLKALTSLFFVLAGLAGYIKNPDRRFFSGPVLAAFLCSMAGDILLAIDRTQGILFVLGVVSFAGAHILFSISFCRICAVKKTDVICTIAVYFVLLSLLLTGDFDFQGLLPVLLGYAVVISFMAAKALSFWRCRNAWGRVSVLVMSGGILFMLSDVVLLFWLFGKGMPRQLQSVNWLIYYLAQGCLSASLSVSVNKNCEEGEKDEIHMAG